MSQYTEWKITYKENGKEKQLVCYSKKAIVHEYLDILDEPFTRGICELKVFKNGKDYTPTLNRFLYH